MNIKLNVLSISCGTILFSSLSYAELIYNNTVDRQREEVVPLIKQGQVDAGLKKLRQFLILQPNNQKLIADYVVMAYENNKFVESDVKYLKGIKPTEFPDYGKVNVLKALRDLKKFDLAEYWAKKFAETDQNQMWTVWIGVLQAEGGKADQARKTLAPIDINYVDADYLAQLAYTYRLLNMPIEAMNAANLAIEKNKNLSTEEQYVLALMVNADYAKAEQYLKKNNSFAKQPQLSTTVKISEFTQRIQNAVQYYKLTVYRGGTQPYQQLDQVIADMDRYEAQLPNDPKLKQQFYYEYIYVLNERNLSKKVLDQIPKTGLSIEQMPPYVRQAIADAYLKAQQPKVAEKIYKDLLKIPNYANFKLYEGLYYAFIEQEKFQSANQLLQEMDKALPTFQYSNAKGVDKVTHDDRIEYLTLVGLNYVYRQEYAKAEQYFEDLVAKAPNNVVYQSNRALVQRWRENPQRSEWILSQWDGIEPVDQGVQIEHLQNIQALGDIQLWRSQLAYLMQTMPDDTAVIKSKKELEDRNHASIQHLSTLSESDSNNSALLNRLKGSREQDHLTRLNSPWFFDNYRTYVDHSIRSAKYDQGKIDDQRVGLGLEWASRRKTANIMLSQSIDNERNQDRFGVLVNWSQWLNDHWQYALGFNSQADIPLQALKKGNEGKAYTFGLNWQQNESREAGLAYQFTDIDDGNARHEASVYVKQQILQGPHHLTSLILGGFYSQNHDVVVDYFNPEESYSGELTLQHDWITWRKYNKNFTQHFEATVGAFGQKGFSTEPIYNVLYQHNWQLSRTWSLNYGIGWGRHPYDGDDEDRTYGTVGFKGNF
ncbi:poly-beta-1,6 N-acetyl-D-glucosamine export porin PgaA [Acinetobacter bouvetii]|nr:poly-beta-1,6 N-acetyl-D-glucosamine export porin PgaA [Acinetobacter bouvetii]